MFLQPIWILKIQAVINHVGANQSRRDLISIETKWIDDVCCPVRDKITGETISEPLQSYPPEQNRSYHCKHKFSSPDRD